MSLSKQQTAVLAHFTRWGTDSDTNTGRALKCPPASVRRTIQELIHLGHNFTFAGIHSGLYVYTPKPAEGGTRG